ncbi:ABC transporter ATP-binding protein [Enterocloster aldenensis]|uniref:ABC transporter ATP-binding protein n=1 Tax=Enterocloster aldenensis TaxID=358742 RepID=UPI00402A227F
MIDVKHVTMEFSMANDKIISLKETLVALLKGKLKYEKFIVLDDVSFHVSQGEVIGIIGKNGAGKSTLLKIIAGVLRPTKGVVVVQGNIVPMLELGSGFDMELTGRENIYLNGAILGYNKVFLDSKYDEIVEFSELGDFIHMPIRNYSSGMMARLAFSIATVVKPEILIVDEILSVGDAGFQTKSLERMMDLMSGGTTVLFVSHSITQIEEMCNRVVWLENHKVKMVGDAKEVCREYKKIWE